MEAYSTCYYNDNKISYPGTEHNRQWRTEGGLGVQNPRNSEDIGGDFDRISKKNRRLDFLL